MLKLYAVRDVKADSFGKLIECPTKGLALRTFLEACQDARSPMAQYPEDFMLYELGEYEPNSGTIKPYPLPLMVASASEVLSAVIKKEPVKAGEEVQS